MERRVRVNSHARCGAGEKLEIISNAYLSLYQHHSKGLVYLLYGVDVSEAKAERLLALDSLCDECDAKDCAYAEDGFCRYPMVRERTPEMADDGQCLGYVFSDSF